MSRTFTISNLTMAVIHRAAANEWLDPRETPLADGWQIKLSEGLIERLDRNRFENESLEDALQRAVYILSGHQLQ